MQHLLSVLQSNPAFAGNEALKSLLHEVEQASPSGAHAGLDVYICSFGKQAMEAGRVTWDMHEIYSVEIYPWSVLSRWCWVY
jgi:hypothetical protein